jgi:hypothetical protein
MYALKLSNSRRYYKNLEKFNQKYKNKRNNITSNENKNLNKLNDKNI